MPLNPRGRRVPKLARAAQQRARENGWRSGLEEGTAAHLDSLGVEFLYEGEKFTYTQTHTYTIDFTIKTKGTGKTIRIETKGYFKPADRGKMKRVRDEHPDLDIRFVFMRPGTRLSKKSPTTYAQWAEKNGFLWADKKIPEEWINE